MKDIIGETLGFVIAISVTAFFFNVLSKLIPHFWFSDWIAGMIYKHSGKR